MAKRAIRVAPLAYAAGTVGHTVGLLFDVNRFSRADLSDSDVGGSGVLGLGRDVWFAVARVSSWVWFVLALGGLAMLFPLFARARRMRTAAAALFATWLVITVGTALAHGGLRRYAAQVAPAVWLLGAAGTAMLISSAARRDP